jgi:hypothetical protein
MPVSRMAITAAPAKRGPSRSYISVQSMSASGRGVAARIALRLPTRTAPSLSRSHL